MLNNKIDGAAAMSAPPLLHLRRQSRCSFFLLLIFALFWPRYVYIVAAHNCKHHHPKAHEVSDKQSGGCGCGIGEICRCYGPVAGFRFTAMQSIVVGRCYCYRQDLLKTRRDRYKC